MEETEHERIYNIESEILSQYKRGLISVEEAISSVTSYIRCMQDMKVLDIERGTEEVGLFVKRIIEGK